jgi:23S rRNA pseudouridine2605 synthase
VPAERLQKVLAAAGIASRRGSEALIEAGRVTVDGKPATIGMAVDPGTARIAVDGLPIAAVAAPSIHLAVHKPIGVTSTVRDRHADRTVLDLVPLDLRPGEARLYPVGRLDLDSEGLLLLTNDGQWAERVLHPRYGVQREYAVGLAEPLDAGPADQLMAGVRLDEGMATLRHLRPATAVETRRLASIVDPPPVPLFWYRLTLGQGMKRQVRRMFGSAGAPIERLVRVRVGPVRLDDLRSGQVRTLTPAEVRGLAGSRRQERRPVSSRP